MNRRGDAGYALLMVIMVLVGLMAIAVPFAVSMRHQERGARGMNDRAQARYAALAARNHALSGVVRGHETREELKTATAPYTTPFTDTLAEFTVDWSNGRTVLGEDGVADGFRGGVLQDEQAKINLRTAPQAVVDRLKARVDARSCDLRDFVTEYSGRPCAWAAPQTVRAFVAATAADGRSGYATFVDDSTSYGEGTRVRVLGNAGEVEYGEVAEVNPQGNEFTVVGLTDGITQQGVLIEAEVRHPINIHTAPAVVIAACLEGLALRNKETEDVLTAAEADALAAAMVKRTFEDMDDFMKWLSEQRGLSVISQFDESAILTNFTNPNSRRLAGRGTLPFVFQSFDYVTVAAHGVQDLPSGAVGAQCDLRQVVEMAPSGTLRFRSRSQYDFERALRLPLGGRVVTWPACVAAREAPSMDRGAPAWITTTTGRDERAAWKIQNHYDPWLMGTKMQGTALQQRAGQILNITGANVDIEAGAAEMWLRTNSTNFTVMHAGAELWSNRIWVHYGYDNVQGGNVLKLCLADSTLEHTLTQITHPVTLTPDTWYHIGAFWKGTKFGQAMLTLDGLPVGTYGVWTEQGQNRHVTLTSALSATDDTVSVTGSTAGFTAPGAIEIGDEAIEYAAVSGSQFTGCIRGARGTAAVAHQAGVGVTVWGYPSKLIRGTLTFNIPNVPAMVWDRLTIGGGNTVGFIGDNTDTIVGPAPPVGVPSVAFPIGALQLTVPTTALPEFPDRGWLTVGAEVVHYDAKNATQFTGITRGLFGTTEVDHFEGEPVRLWGFHVTDNTNYLSPTVLSIDDEWFGPVVKEGTDGWRGVTASMGGLTIPIPLRRGNNNLFLTPAADHATNTPVYPTFALADASAGADDVVTFVEQDPATREEHTIRHVRWVPNLPLASASPEFLLASLDANVAKEWVPDNRWVRILKFPSGELMGVPQQLMTFGGMTAPTTDTPMAGYIDELRLQNGPKFLGFVISLPIDAAATTVPILDVSGMDAEGGAIRVGNEVIGYAGVDATTNTLVNCTRGYLGTTATPHDPGARVFNLAFLAIAALTGNMTAADKAVPCVPNGFPGDGYLLVDQELIGYTHIGSTGPTTPPTVDFRGAYGTTPAPHSTNALAYAFPFRYYDRFTALCDDSQIAWWGTAFRATDARWQRLTFEERLPNNSVDIRVNVRFDGLPRWTMAPNNRPFASGRGGVWQFNAPNGGTFGNIEADMIEIKVEFVWLDDAYRNGQWKESPEFRGVAVEYEQEPVIHVHEEK